MSTQAERLQSHTWALGTTTAPLGPMMPFGPNGLTLSIVTRVRCLPGASAGRNDAASGSGGAVQGRDIRPVGSADNNLPLHGPARGNEHHNW